jgi:hypothetical protein
MYTGNIDDDDNDQAIGFGGSIDQTADLYWDVFNKPFASIFGIHSEVNT